jgi:peptidoglycan/LPS O-acetylase OafA/YrhL
MQMPETKHFHDLDGMRGILAVAVMAFHYGLNTVIATATRGMIHDSQWGLCVDFFFMLSGFVLMHSFARRPVSAMEYARRRFWRLYPAFIVTTLITLPITMHLGRDVGLGTGAANLLMIQSIVGLKSINPPGWSIPFEFFIPVIAVAIFGARIARVPVQVAWALLAIGVAVGAATDLILTTGADNLGGARALAGLTGGMALYRIRTANPPVGSRTWAALSALAAAIAIITVAGSWPPLAALFHSVALAAIWFGANSSSFLARRPFDLVGRLSYSIYLIHFPVLLATEATFGKVNGDIGAKVLMTLSAFVLAYLTYRFVERPGMAQGARYKQAAPA